MKTYISKCKKRWVKYRPTIYTSNPDRQWLTQRTIYLDGFDDCFESRVNRAKAIWKDEESSNDSKS